jgi:polysaccharide deacetylase family protein (PEP-CTERM system associated)
MTDLNSQLKPMKIPLLTTAACPFGTTPDVFTIDVEDWFHILEVTGTPALTAWDSLPTRLEPNFRALLDLLAAYNVRATCFTLGWVANRFSRLLREAADLGHEIASHGYSHQLVSELSRLQFREDIRTAKAAIEDATGRPVCGYRAPGFSITRDMHWAFDEIIEAGYIFDSSIFPAHHGHGGISGAPRSLIEFPISVVDTPIGPQCCFGGGYLRLLPLWLVLAMARRVRNDERGVVWYIHPREIDPNHPRLQMSLKRRFKSYVNLRGTTGKLKAILRTGDFVTFSELTSRLSEAKLTGV